jgi:arylsulfatase
MKKQPNVLLVFVDQMRGDAIAALGNPIIKTPNLDRLVNEGVAYTSAYSPSPVCISARCSMTYGQYPFNTGCYENSAMPEDERPGLMSALSAGGYRTHGIGKCHFTPDLYALRGFQTRETQEEMVDDPSRDDYMRFLTKQGLTHLTDPHGVRSEMYYVPQPAQMPAKYHPTQWIGDRSVAFINGQAKRKKPWFLFSSFIHPHPPFAPPAPWHKLYRAPDMPDPFVPKGYEDLLTHVNRRQNRYKFRDQGLDRNLLRCMKAHYYGCISFIDYQVGRLLDSLKKSGQLKDTLIVFTSDHGELLGDFNSFGKRSMHDAAARVPLIIRGAGPFSGGVSSKLPASLVDVTPTILGAAGLSDAGRGMDGIDLAAPPAESKRTVFTQCNYGAQGTHMALNSRYKYIYSAPDNKEFLFARKKPWRESVNLISHASHRASARALKKELIERLKAAGEEAVLKGNGWKKFPRLKMPADPDAGLIRQDHSWAKHVIPGYNDG